MPVYEYQCIKCNKIFEKFQNIKNIKKTITCECGSTAKKIISNTSFVLTGKGWAKDGYSKEKR